MGRKLITIITFLIFLLLVEILFVQLENNANGNNREKIESGWKH